MPDIFLNAGGVRNGFDFPDIFFRLASAIAPAHIYRQQVAHEGAQIFLKGFVSMSPVYGFFSYPGEIVNGIFEYGIVGFETLDQFFLAGRCLAQPVNGEVYFFVAAMKNGIFTAT